MDKNQAHDDHDRVRNGKRVVGRFGRIVMAIMTSPRIRRLASAAMVAFALVAVGGGDWGMRDAGAAVSTARVLTLTGPSTGLVGKPFNGVVVHLANSGPAAPDSRLRLLVHDGADRELASDDITVELNEGGRWVPLPREPIDGGVFAAIGAKGDHLNRHKRDGFPIPANSQRSFQLRFVFRLPGVYSLVVAVSPDNGATHFAQPASLAVEVQ